MTACCETAAFSLSVHPVEDCRRLAEAPQGGPPAAGGRRSDTLRTLVLIPRGKSPTGWKAVAHRSLYASRHGLHQRHAGLQSREPPRHLFALLPECRCEDREHARAV